MNERNQFVDPLLSSPFDLLHLIHVVAGPARLHRPAHQRAEIVGADCRIAPGDQKKADRVSVKVVGFAPGLASGTAI